MTQDATIVRTLRFSFEDATCDHEGCGAPADRLFIYHLSDRQTLMSFACPDHPDALGPNTIITSDWYR